MVSAFVFASKVQTDYVSSSVAAASLGLWFLLAHSFLAGPLRMVRDHDVLAKLQFWQDLFPKSQCNSMAENFI